MVKFFSTKKSTLTEKSQLLHGPIFLILLEKKILENVINININIVEQSRRRGFFCVRHSFYSLKPPIVHTVVN
jgi:hypothetical protein